MVEKTEEHTNEIVFTYGMFTESINVIIEKLKNKKYDGIFALPRGGLILAVVLSHKLKLPLCDKYTKNTLIVDDICDKGHTLVNIPSINDKVVLVTKPIGSIRIKNIIYVLKVPDNTWVKFWWEVL